MNSVSVRSIRDERVKAATGKGWDAWFRLLDRWGARRKTHKETASHLRTDLGLSSWWSQMVAVEYERARGLRDVRQRSDGAFAVDVARTIACGLRQAFAAWKNPAQLSRWFTTKSTQDFRVGGRYANADGDSGTYLAIEPLKRIRFTWENPRHKAGSVVEVRFTAKDDGRTLVAVSHRRLRTKKETSDLKQAWSWAMDSCKSYLETGAGIPHEVWLAARRATARKSR